MPTVLRFPLGLVLAVAATIGTGALRIPAGPDFFLFAVAAVSRSGRPVPAMLAGLAAGLVEDSLRSAPRLLGLHAFTKIVLGYLLAELAARFTVGRPTAAGAVLGAAVLVESGLVSLLLLFLQGDLALSEPLPLLLRVTTTAAGGAALLAASRVPWQARFAPRRRRSLPKAHHGP